MAFLFNFIPTIGPLLATLLPLPVVVLDPDMPLAAKVLAIALPAAVQCVFAVIQPRVQGGAQDLHPVTAMAALVFVLCVWCLFQSFRRAGTRSERHQVQWIFLAALISLVLIGYLLSQAAADPATLGRDSSAWPMFGVSLLFTLSYAVSITRYKLMRVEPIIKRSMVSVVISVSAGLLYSAVLLLSGVIFRDRLLTANPTWRGAMVAGVTVVLALMLSELARGRFQKALDRRFYREKYKFDQAMRKMNVAVGSLVDRETLGRRLLEAAAEVLRLEWGAIYLRDEAEAPFRLAACHGPTPDDRLIAPENPLARQLGRVAAFRVPHTVALAGSFEPASDAMIALGGEAAAGLQADGHLAGLLILGPKRSGMPYEDEELAFLGALSSVATLALHSAGIQETLETLNHELRDKVEKIAEQQRRILMLQDQLTGAPAAEPDGDALPTRGLALNESTMDAMPMSGRDRAAAEPSVFDRIKGASPAVRRMIETARKVADSASAVLIRGESGTGKELLAEAIHAASPRAARPFVKVHCAALSQTLLESELFGHVKGAFTSADRDRVGRFEQANGGTLFLDEIGDINLEVQTKLLRVLQEMAFERVGSSQTFRVDVRILAATHQDLEALIAAGRFREDLYYRLNVISLRTPSLRERKEDVFELAVHFLRHHARRNGKSVSRLDEGAVEALEAHDWPGNVRELENVIERAVVLADGPTVTREDLPIEVVRPSRRRVRPPLPVAALETATAAKAATPRVRHVPDDPDPASSSSDADADESSGSPWDAEFVAYERQRLLDALEDARGNKSEAARLLGMPRSTFCSKLKKHGMG
jgi:transcriptional regulator with GAF, ATPase, and Fis domain